VEHTRYSVACRVSEVRAEPKNRPPLTDSRTHAAGSAGDHLTII